MSNSSDIMSRWVAIVSSQCTFGSPFFFRLFHSFLSVPGGQPAGRQGCREVFSSSTWVRETDGACQTVVCGFIQIYDGRKWGWMWTGRVGEERRRREAGGPAFGFILKHWKPLDGGGGSQHSGVVVWIDCVLFQRVALCITALSSTEEGVLAFTLNSITSLPGHRAVFQIAWLASAEISLTQRHLVLFPTNLVSLVSPLILTIQDC